MADLMFSLQDVGKTRPGDDSFTLHIKKLDVPRGSMLALVGPSGCGKSTALDMLACILQPELMPSGSNFSQTDSAENSQSAERRNQHFLFQPTPQETTDVLTAWRMGGMDALALLRLRHMGYVLQTGGLLPFLSARENIFLRCKSLGIRARQRKTAVAVVESLGIGHLLRQYPTTLSVGERQRVAIAGALAHGPSVVLADEPTAALDPYHAKNVLRLFAELARNMGITVIMVTHNLEQARKAGFALAEVVVTQGAHGIAATIAWTQEVP